MALKMHKIPSRNRNGESGPGKVRKQSTKARQASTAHSSSLTVAQSFLALRVKRMTQGGYIKDIIKQRELDQEQQRVTPSGSQRALSGVLQEEF